MRFGLCAALMAAGMAANAETIAVSAAKLIDVQIGKFGDIIGVAGDPLTDVTVLEHVAFVMKGGEVFKNEVRQATP